MNKSINCWFVTICLVLLISCKKDADIQIESLSKSGEEFYFGEKVPVWAATSGDKDGIGYEWSATGGSFDGFRTQNLFENLWIAPSQPGEYTITAKAKNGGSNSSRSTSMKVTRYYFDEFQSAYTFNGNGWSTSNTSNVLKNNTDAALSTAEITASSTSTPNIRRSLNLSELKIPFSIRTKIGWNTFYRAGQNTFISLYFAQPANVTIPYIREIRWEFLPTANPATTNNYQIRFETFVPATNTSQWSTPGNTFPLPGTLIEPVAGRSALFSMAANQLKNFTFSVDKDNIFSAHVDGALWFTSNSIKDWLAKAKLQYPGFADPVAKEFRVTFPARSGTTGTTIVLKSVYINNDGTILQ